MTVNGRNVNVHLIFYDTKRILKESSGWEIEKQAIGENVHTQTHAMLYNAAHSHTHTHAHTRPLCLYWETDILPSTVYSLQHHTDCYETHRKIGVTQCDERVDLSNITESHQMLASSIQWYIFTFDFCLHRSSKFSMVDHVYILKIGPWP